MPTSATTIVIKKILSISPASGEVKAYSERTVQGELQVVKKTSPVVRFQIGPEHFVASAKEFRNRKSGSIFVA